MKQTAEKKKRNKPAAKEGPFAVLAAGLLVSTALVFSLLIIFRHAPEPEKPVPPPAAYVPPARSVPERALVFVIDDAGNNLHELEPFLLLDIPLTIAVLPGLPGSAEAARRAREAGKEVFLHQPMEAIGGQNPGPGAIMAGMGRDEIRAIIKQNLNEIGPVTGMNNHTGSRLTADEVAMETILSLCSEMGIHFLDSRTTARSVAPEVAGRLGITIAERDVFLDNDPSSESILGYINVALQTAVEKNYAIMIGHAQSAALAPLIAGLLPDLKEKGFSFSTVSGIINMKRYESTWN